MKKFLFLTLLFLLITPKIFAISDPLDVPNNKYGIHVADVNDISEAAKLVNSNNGDWGYITVVIPENDRNVDKWQAIMNNMRRLHLIPIIRLATKVENSVWLKPEENNIDNWVNFLNKLNWPVKNRYVILFNEPNHAKEWGGTVDPDGYADIAIKFAVKLKSVSDDFFILPAGLDAAAANYGETMDISVFLREINNSHPDFFNLIDGWNSHSYPNPAFSGSPIATGKGTIKSYDWELNFLKSIGINKEYPVFITETGWMHSQGKSPNNSLLSPDTVADYIRISAGNVWSDNRIVAITPFLYNYQDYPFDHFSWKQLGKNEFYTQYNAYADLAKIKGLPKKNEAYSLVNQLFPDYLVLASEYSLSGILKNSGQGLFNPADGYSLTFQAYPSSLSIDRKYFPIIEPGEEKLFSFRIKTPTKIGDYEIETTIDVNGQKISTLEHKKVKIVAPPSLLMTINLGWRKNSSAINVRVLVYDSANYLIASFRNLEIFRGNLYVPGLTNIIPGKIYRIVILAPNYLPRQKTLFLANDVSYATISRFYPLDLDNDGTFTFKDVIKMLQIPPKDLLGLII
jgi:hypothetical protein